MRISNEELDLFSVELGGRVAGALASENCVRSIAEKYVTCVARDADQALASLSELCICDLDFKTSWAGIKYKLIEVQGQTATIKEHLDAKGNKIPYKESRSFYVPYETLIFK